MVKSRIFPPSRVIHHNILFAALLFSLTTFFTLLKPGPSTSAQKLEAQKLEEKIEEKRSGTNGDQTVSMLLTGDIMLGRYIATLRERNGGDFPFNFMPDILTTVKEKLNVNDLDLVMANLEGPIVDQQVAWGDLVFQFDPEVTPLLAKVGFTGFSLANNHTFNQRREGWTETRMHLSNVGLDSFGHPDMPNGEFSFLRYDFGEISVGFLGLNDTDFKLDIDETVAQIRERDPQVDHLVVAIHWGFEYEALARESVVAKAHAFVDAGADLIWGAHPHVIQNSEIYNGKSIYYSLGNFVFDQYWSEATQEGLILGVKIENGTLSVAEVLVDLVNGGEPKPREY